MGRLAQSAWIIFGFAILASAALLPRAAMASAVAQGVALNASAGCSNGNLDITLTTVGANREGWRATDLNGSTISQGNNPAGLANFSGTFVGFQIVFSPAQSAGSQVASYAYVGETPPSATDTAEFFVFYNCSTREVLLSCYGPYGTCPQTAQQALALLAPRIPTQGPLALTLTALLLAETIEPRTPLTPRVSNVVPDATTTLLPSTGPTVPEPGLKASVP